MAEAYLKKFGGDKYQVESAGLEPSKLNGLVVEVMKEDGIDISNNPTNDVFEFHQQGKTYDTVITVCDQANAERCPVFPSMSKKIAWSFEDPSSFVGSHEEKLAKTRQVRDAIKQTVKEFVTQHSNA